MTNPVIDKCTHKSKGYCESMQRVIVEAATVEEVVRFDSELIVQQTVCARLINILRGRFQSSRSGRVDGQVDGYEKEWSYRIQVGSFEWFVPLVCAVAADQCTANI